MAKNKNTIEEFFDTNEKTINAEDMLHKNMRVYGLDVLEDRALADYRDGLKPAQRRLMWTARDLKATWENKTVKSARIMAALRCRWSWDRCPRWREMKPGLPAVKPKLPALRQRPG